jgi:nitroreductase
MVRQTAAVEMREVIRRRRMVRSFSTEPVAPATVDRLLEDALRAPSAGNAGGVAWLVLVGAETADYWQRSTTPDWRAVSPRWPGLSRAPVVALALFSSEVYADRYAEDDKQRWGDGTASWPVPYWVGDAAFAVMTLLLGAEDAELACCFLGNFGDETALLDALGVPAPWRLFGSVLLGHPDGADRRSGSLDRPGPARRARMHHGRWDAT